MLRKMIFCGIDVSDGENVMLKRMRWYLWILAGILLIYLVVAVYFMDHFFMGTVVNGQKAEFCTVKQVNGMILEQARAYELTLLERGDRSETLTADLLGADFSETEEVRRQKRVQNGFLWPRMFWQQDHFQIGPEVSIDEGVFEASVEKLSCIQEGEKPQNAWAEITENGYRLHREKEGSLVRKERLKEEIRSAVKELTPSLDLEKAGCYEEPEITAQDEEIKQLQEKLDTWFSAEVTYEFGSQTEKADAAAVARFVKVDGCDASLDAEAVSEWVAELAERRDTYKKARSFQSTLRGVITVKGGNYGWKIDQEAESAALLASVENGETVSREPVYSHRGRSWGEKNDVGDTYIEVDMGAQHMWAYKNGELVIDTDVVTGNISKNYGTPAIVAEIQYKDRNAVLRGANYATPVKYWMPFYGNYGIHDASWRRAFGGTVYLTGGSHGCVNTPPAAMKVIFENMEKGTPVVLYY